MNSVDYTKIFNKSIEDYHRKDDVDILMNNPFKEDKLEYLLYKKSWIDTVQWHLEDQIRHPEINPARALIIKRRIDKLNQERTNIVEKIDDYFLNRFKCVPLQKDAGLNTESPAWAIDRLSILQLKIYHMKQETQRPDASEKHRRLCHSKLQVLLLQESDLSLAIDLLLKEISAGKKIMKVYRQMKMYNDEETNPVLYSRKS